MTSRSKLSGSSVPVHPGPHRNTRAKSLPENKWKHPLLNRSNQGQGFAAFRECNGEELSEGQPLYRQI